MRWVEVPIARSLSGLCGLLAGGLVRLLLGLLGGDFGKKNLVDVGENSAGCDGDSAEELVELLIVPHGQLDVSGNDAVLLVVAGSVPGELEDLGGEVLEDSAQIHGGASSDASGVLPSLQVSSDATDGELEPGLAGPGLGLLPVGSASSLSSLTPGGSWGSGFSFRCHVVCLHSVLVLVVRI